MRPVTLGEYRNLMRAFVGGLIGESDFNAEYGPLRQQDDAQRLPDIAEILGSVDRSVDGPDLRAVVTVALRKLDAMKHGA